MLREFREYDVNWAGEALTAAGTATSATPTNTPGISWDEQERRMAPRIASGAMATSAVERVSAAARLPNGREALSDEADHSDPGSCPYFS